MDNPLVRRIISLFLLPRGESLPQEKEYLVDTCYGNCNGYPVIARRSEAGNMIRLQTITAHTDQCREGITLNQRAQDFRALFCKWLRTIQVRPPRYICSFPRSIRKCGDGWVSDFAGFHRFPVISAWIRATHGYLPYPPDSIPHSPPRDSSMPDSLHENPLLSLLPCWI